MLPCPGCCKRPCWGAWVISERVFLCMPARGEMAGSHSRSPFSFLRNLHSVLRSGGSHVQPTVKAGLPGGFFTPKHQGSPSVCVHVTLTAVSPSSPWSASTERPARLLPISSRLCLSCNLIPSRPTFSERFLPLFRFAG